ncbi:MAG: YqaE/Pmp3 family membrane protein [Oceanipulchritudo sp.]
MNPVVLIILAILLPPVAVYLKEGANKQLVINIILCFIFWIPAIVHALYLVTKK